MFLLCVMASKHVDRSLTDKVQVLGAICETGAKRVKVAEKFGVSKTVV